VRHWLIEIHDVCADSVLGDVAAGQACAQRTFLLFARCHHFVVDRARGEIRHARQLLKHLFRSHSVFLARDCRNIVRV
jgi:hypothetical protein